MNILEKVAQPHRDVVYRILQERAPELLASLLSKESPSYAEVEQVEDVMYDVVTKHFGPDPMPRSLFLINLLNWAFSSSSVVQRSRMIARQSVRFPWSGNCNNEFDFHVQFKLRGIGRRVPAAPRGAALIPLYREFPRGHQYHKLSLRK